MKKRVTMDDAMIDVNRAKRASVRSWSCHFPPSCKDTLECHITGDTSRYLGE